VCAAQDACLTIPALRGSRVELLMGIHLPVEDWADVHIGQFLEINISWRDITKN